MVVTYGNFRAVDLGDLTKDKDTGWCAPITSSGRCNYSWCRTTASTLLIRPRWCTHCTRRWPSWITALTGRAADVWQLIHASPGLEDLWQLHYSVDAGKDHNSSDPFVANIDEICRAQWLKVTVEKDGEFLVWNQRNKFEKTYNKR